LNNLGGGIQASAAGLPIVRQKTHGNCWSLTHTESTRSEIMAAARTALVSCCNSTWNGLIAICLIQPSNHSDREDWSAFSEFSSNGPRPVRSGRSRSVTFRLVWRLFARRRSLRKNQATTGNSRPPISQPLSRYERRARNERRK